jgi:hypothetical protein
LEREPEPSRSAIPEADQIPYSFYAPGVEVAATVAIELADPEVEATGHKNAMSENGIDRRCSSYFPAQNWMTLAFG